ncbi:flagellar hook-length control protein FliK [Nitrosovibrio tenuis]|nr:flagellar hook-length control protein FliK [Nitrosovibrio tenuis]
MNDRTHMSEARSTNINTSVQAGKNERATAAGSEGGDASVDPGEDTPGLRKASKTEATPASSAPLQLVNFATMLPDLHTGMTTGQSVQPPAEALAITGAHAHIDVRIGHDLDAQAHVKSENGVNATARSRAGTLAEDLLADVAQAEQLVDAAAYAGFAGLPAGFIPIKNTHAGTGAGPVTAAGDRAALKIADGSTGVSAGLSAGMTDGVQEGGVGRGRSAALQNTVIQLNTNARQDGLKSQEFSLPEKGFTGELAKLADTSSGATPQNLSTIQTETVLSVATAERGFTPGILSTAESSPDHSLSRLEPRLGSAGWDVALGQKVVWTVSQQQQIAELSLNPPDLGPLQVILSVNNDQASAMFISQSADVRQALEAALPKLKEMMADSGISLGNTTVNSDNSQQNEWLEGSEGRNNSGGHHSDVNGGAPTSTSDGARVNITGISISGLIDTFA